MICCVLNATVAAFSDGRAHASSYELVWRDWVPPMTVAKASIVVRMILFRGCCQVSDAAEFWAWVGRGNERGSFAGDFSFITRAQVLRAPRKFATSST